MRFSDFVDINPKTALTKGEIYPCVMMEEIIPGNKFVSGALRKKFSGGGAKFKKGDTLFARITPCLENGKIAQYTGQNSEFGFGSTEFFVFRDKKGESDNQYIYYLALSDIIRKPAEVSMFGASGRQRADLSVVQNIEIEPPRLLTQRKIAGILSTYDELIENNNRRIKILEEMARLIYKEWFVKFRFPGYEKVKMVDSELGKIPERWGVRKISESFKTVLGGTPSRKVNLYWNNGNIPWINSGKINDIRIINESEFITKEGLGKSAAKIIPKKSTVIAITGATLGQVSLTEIDVCTNQSVVGIFDENKLLSEYLYLFIKDNIDKIVSKAGGSAQQHINKEIVDNSEIIIPKSEISRLFKKIVEPIFDLIAMLLFKNSILRQARDMLLPKLIGGEIDVSDLDIK